MFVKVTKISVDVDSETFEPIATYELTIPLQAIQDGNVLMSRDDLIQTLGKELLESLEKSSK